MQITKTERQEIAHFLQKKYTIREIASLIGKSPSTISREIRRNSICGKYEPKKAHQKQNIRRKNCRWSFKKIRAHPEFEIYLERMLREKWSPEQIAGRWNLTHQPQISHTTIYKYLYSHFGNHLCRYLLSQRFSRKKRQPKTERQMIPNRIWIDERPAEIEKRIEIGHWEGDTVCSRRGDRTSLLVLEERTSRYLLAEKIPDKKPARVQKLIARATSNLDFKSLTLDNGIEFRHHEKFGCETYFCHPYSSWEKGSVEYANRLLRRYLPKKSYLKNYSNRFVQSVVW